MGERRGSRGRGTCSVRVEGGREGEREEAHLDGQGDGLCGNQISGAPRHRRDVVSVTAYARWRACSTYTPSTRIFPHGPLTSSAAGSSDPFAKFEVTGGDSTSKPFKSQTKYKTLCPRWNELFQVPLKKGEVQPRLEVLLYDEDEVSSPDFMGRISIEISEFCSTKAAKREWFTLLPEEGKSDNVKGAVELIAQWWYNPALDFEPFMEPDDH